MVSKIAVIALVAIVACPILLGYAFNLSEVTETVYEPTGESVNVTQLLQNGSAYSMVHGDIYTLNSNTSVIGDQNPSVYYKNVPKYETINSVYSSFPMYYKFENTWFDTYTISSIQDYSWFYGQLNYNPSQMVTITLYKLVGGVETSMGIFGSVSSFYYDAATETTSLSLFYNDGIHYELDGQSLSGKLTKVVYQRVGTFSGANVIQMGVRSDGSTNTFVDLSAGFHFDSYPNDWAVDLPDYTRSVLFTINLDSITGSSYNIYLETVPLMNTYLLEKTTVDGTVYWKLKNPDNSEVFDLYYDPSRSDNTYQIYLELNKSGDDGTHKNYDHHLEFRYVGGWPKIIGAANTYLRYTEDKIVQTASSIPDLNLDHVWFYQPSNNLSRSFTMRVDDAYYRAFQYPTIENQIYDPATFKTNPSTVLGDVKMFGSFITFGGNNYSVGSDGNIVLGTHRISLNNAVFDSIPVVGGYENRINGITVSTTATPSTITFGGKWGASITTTAQTSTTKTITDWTPGQFAWNGIDQNFLMAGLFTIMGVFIGLGIYAKARRMSIWPLLIVCGGAAALFLFML